MADQKISDLTSLAAADTNDVLAIVDVSASATKKITPVGLKAGMSLAKADVGLGNVDNTSDANKPISNATQTALNGKQDALGYTPEDVANKSNNTGLGTSTVLYPTQNAVKTYVDTGLAGKRDKSSRSRFVMIETDFTSIQTGNIDGVAYVAIASGTITATVAEGANHPGIVMFRDAAAVNSGYRIMSETSAVLLAGGEKFVVVFKTRDARTTSTVQMGFFDNNAAGSPTDCACFIMNGNGTNVDIRGRTRANNTATETSVQTLAINTWYTGEIEVNANATSCQFTVYNENGTTLFTQSLGNLPTAAGRETGFGLMGFESTTDAANDLVGFDYMRVEINRNLVR
jgi:hypothetical protein